MFSHKTPLVFHPTQPISRRQTRSSKRNFMFKPFEESVCEKSSCSNAQLNTELLQGLTTNHTPRRVRGKF